MNKSCYKCNLPKDKKMHYGLHAHCFMEWFKVSSLEDFKDVVLKFTSAAPQINTIPDITFYHGNFRKYSAQLGESRYILKIEQSEYPELPFTEYLCNQIFQSLNVKVPPFFLISFKEEDSLRSTCFVTENFMSFFSGSNLVHFYHFFTSVAYDCENAVRIIGERIGRIAAQEDFVYLTLADSLIGNDDRHGRNLGLIDTSKGYVLAPFYDNVSNLGTEVSFFLGADLQPRGKIVTKNSNEPSMKQYVDEWNRLGYANVIERFKKNLDLKKIKKLIEESYLSKKRKNAFFNLIKKRSEELCS